MGSTLVVPHSREADYTPTQRHRPRWRTQARLSAKVALVVVVPLLVYWYCDFIGRDILELYAASILSSHRADPHLQVNWNYTSDEGKLRIVSAAQDHRQLVGNLSGVHRGMFPGLNKLPYARLFQLHAAYGGTKLDPNLKTQFWIYALKDTPLPDVPSSQALARDSGETDETGRFVVIKLDAGCRTYQPQGYDWRMQQGTLNNDLIIRCIAFLTPQMIDQALCANSYIDVECKIGHVVVHEIDSGKVHFPMDKIMHFPYPVKLYSGPVAPTSPKANSFPTAPWRANGLAPMPVVRASSEAAKVRTCAWVSKKFTWDVEDELWLLWMLDIVGVDFIVVYLNPSEHTGYNDALFRTTTTPDAVRKRLEAHKGVSERVLLIESHIPGSPITHEHMVEGMHWDAFVRLQHDCDYGFSLDMDEFVELFSTEAPNERVDVKTFIAQRQKAFNADQCVYMHRVQMRRTSLPGVADETMPPFLVRWLHYPSVNRTNKVSTWPFNPLGKSLWRLTGSVAHYLHHPVDVKKPVVVDELAYSRMLHIRLDVGFANNNFGGESKAWFPQPAKV